MVPSSAMQMALANLLRGARPQQTPTALGDVESAVGALPPIPGLPNVKGGGDMSGQMAMASALAGGAPPPAMGPASTPPPAGILPAGGELEEEDGESEEDDLSSILAGDFERQRQRSAAIARQRAAGNLGLLTGDRVLTNFGQAQLNQAEAGNPNSLRYLDLLQKQQRLAQQAATEERQGRQGDERLGLAKEDYKTRSALGWSSLGQRRQEHTDELELERLKAERRRQEKLSDDETKLRNEFLGNPIIKETQQAEVNFAKVQDIARDPNPANDIALIFSVMKTYDPSSTVRESEFASAQNAANVPDRIRNAFNRVREGTILNPKQRQEFVNSARIYLQASQRKAGEIANGYRKTAIDSGFEPDRVIQPGLLSGLRGRQGGVPTTSPSESMPRGADGNPTLDAGGQAPRPKKTHTPLNKEPFVYTRPPNPKPGGVYMFNPKGFAFWVPEDGAEGARAKGWKDVP